MTCVGGEPLICAGSNLHIILVIDVHPHTLGYELIKADGSSFQREARLSKIWKSYFWYYTSDFWIHEIWFYFKKKKMKFIAKKKFQFYLSMDFFVFVFLFFEKESNFVYL